VNSLAVLIQYVIVTDLQTDKDRQTHGIAMYCIMHTATHKIL